MERDHSKPVVHLELHTDDLPSARDFYAGLCGWSPEQIEHRHGTYLAMDLGRGAPGGGIVECRTIANSNSTFIRARRRDGSGLHDRPEEIEQSRFPTDCDTSRTGAFGDVRTDHGVDEGRGIDIRTE